MQNGVANHVRKLDLTSELPKAGCAGTPENVRRTCSPSICGGDGLQVRRTTMRAQLAEATKEETTAGLALANEL